MSLARTTPASPAIVRPSTSASSGVPFHSDRKASASSMVVNRRRRPDSIETVPARRGASPRQPASSVSAA